MKLRHGFVSNSSSSSFVLMLSLNKLKDEKFIETFRSKAEKAHQLSVSHENSYVHLYDKTKKCEHIHQHMDHVYCKRRDTLKKHKELFIETILDGLKDLFTNYIFEDTYFTYTDESTFYNENHHHEELKDLTRHLQHTFHFIVEDYIIITSHRFKEYGEQKNIYKIGILSEHSARDLGIDYNAYNG